MSTPQPTEYQTVLAQIAKAQGRKVADLHAPMPFGVLKPADYAILAKGPRS